MRFRFGPERRHAIRVLAVGLGAAALIGWVAVYGFDYYMLPRGERPFHPRHAQLRSSGPVGLRLGILGMCCFLAIYLYAIRKRWKTLNRFGRTRHWLDIHVVLGIAAPALITFHAGFRTGGLAGIAYWIMLAVMASGIVGRYLYAQIPRSISAAEMSLEEMEALARELGTRLDGQEVVSRIEMAALLRLPSEKDVAATALPLALLLMLRYDVMRLWHLAAIRRRAVSGAALAFTLYGLLPSRDRRVEEIIDVARRRSWLATKLTFLSKTQAVFHLWHVVHRPFSYSFAVLVFVHVTVVALMGYF